jgi:hypothetical protein
MKFACELLDPNTVGYIELSTKRTFTVEALVDHLLTAYIDAVEQATTH